MEVLSAPVLVLNKNFEPVHLTTARRAFVLLYGGAAKALDEEGETYDFDLWSVLPVREVDDEVRTVGGRVRVPRVLHLDRYDRTPRLQVRLSRRNVMARDAHQCQYCGRRPALRELNIDHVVPRSRGGVDAWENLVTSCKPCNLRKGWRTPDEANMLLLRRPFRPKWNMSAQILMGTGSRYREWEPFLRAG